MVAEEAGLNLEVEGDTGLVVIHFEPLVHTPHTKKTRVIGGRGRGVCIQVEARGNSEWVQGTGKK